MKATTRRRGLIFANILTMVLPIIIVTSVWYAGPTQPTHSCVTLHVDYGISSKDPVFDACIPEFEKANAYGLLASWHFGYIGTKLQGPKEICRVYSTTHYAPSSSLPIKIPGRGNYIEHCIDKPGSFAHWAVIIKRAGHEKSKAINWRYTNKKLWDITLYPGDGVGLVFVVNHKLVLPENKAS
jgi:hypothetical protein